MHVLPRLLAIATLAAFATPALAQTNPEVVEVSAQTQQVIDNAEAYLPDGEWRLSPNVGGCSVRRDFARDGAQVSLVMRRLQSGMPIQFALVGSEFSEEEPVEAGFVPGTGLARFTRLAGAQIGGREGFVFAGDPFPRGEEAALDESVQAARVQHYVVQGEEGAPIVLRTGPISQPLTMLADCAAEGLASLGVVAAARGSSPRLRNTEEVSAWMRANYPGGAIRDGRQGPVPVRIVVGPDGRATHCHVGNYLTARVLRDAACDAFTNTAEYEPARDVQGQPITAAFYTQAIFLIAPTPGF